MTAFILILVQLTVLIALAILAASVFHNNFSRAHRVLLAGLASLLFVPLLSITVDHYGFGIFPPVQDAVAISSEPDFEPESEQRVFGESIDANPEPINPTLVAVAPVQRPDVNMSMEAANSTVALATPIEIPESTEIVKSHNEFIRPETSPSTALNAEVTAPTWASKLYAQLSLPKLVSAVWLIWSCWILISMLIGTIRAAHITFSSRHVEDIAMASFLASAKVAVGYEKPIRLQLSDQVPCPVVWSWFRPTIIVPADSLQKDMDWQAVFVHELAHLKRKDHWSTLLAESIKCLLPWHPLVRLACRRMYRFSELACDTWAVRYAKSAEHYAEALLEFSPMQRQIAFSSMAINESSLSSRVNWLLSKPSNVQRTGAAFTSLLLVCAMLSTVAVSLLRCYEPANPAALIAVNDENDEDKEDETIEDVDWKSKLTSPPESSRWWVGKNLGVELAGLPGDQGYKILKEHWNEIAVSVRTQILKGFYPSNDINDRYFDVMNLGMRSGDPDIRSFATTYLKQVINIDFKVEPERYTDFYQSTNGLTADEVVAKEFSKRIAKGSELDKENAKRLLDAISNSPLVSNPAVRNAILDAGFESLLERWKQNGVLDAGDRAFKLVTALKKQQNNPAQPANVDENSTNQQWVNYLTAIPDNSQWFVGSNIGVQMSQLPDNRAYEILQQCWPEIAPSVRCQMLKGFTPGFGINELNANYMEILELGIKSEESQVRSFASGYLENLVFEKISNGEEFDRWKTNNGGKSPADITKALGKQFLKDLDTMDALEFESRVEPIVKRIESSKQLKQFLLDAGIVDKLAKRIENEQISFAHRHTTSLLQTLPIPNKLMDLAIEKDLQRLVADWESFAKTGKKSLAFQKWGVAMNLGMTKNLNIIPTVIALIDADNTYQTVYGFGYFALKDVTGVAYSKHHDGAWWKRWWEENRDSMPAHLRNQDIPELTKTAHSKAYVPYPESLETSDGAIEWMLEQHAAGKDYKVALELLSEDYKESKCIPTLIGMLDSDNSPQSITKFGRALRELTNVQYDPLSDGTWWRNWWNENKSDYPEAANIPIPVLPKTEFGQTYVSLGSDLNSLEAKIEKLKSLEPNSDSYNRIFNSIERQNDSYTAKDIPILIGLIDSDNSYDTVYHIGHFCLRELTDVNYSPLHDGAWWQRWWDKNKKRYSQSVQQIAIPVLPKTKHGSTYEPLPVGLETLDGMIAFLNSNPSKKGRKAIYSALSSSSMGDNFKDIDIPKLIGILDSDNSYDTSFSIGEYGLGRNVGVDYLPIRDGAWWRRWWDRNKSKYSEAAQNTPIPAVAKSTFGITYQPLPASLDKLEGRMEWIRKGCPGCADMNEVYLGNILFEDNDPAAIPFLIGWMVASKSTDAIRSFPQNLTSLTKIKPVREQTVEWWVTWWDKNKARFPSAQNIAVPDLTESVAAYKAVQAKMQQKKLEEEFAGIPSVKRTIDDDEKKTYFQIGPKSDAKAPKDGWKVLLILPGGDGSADFNPWCRRIHQNALPDDYIAVQLVAPVWSKNENRVVWPTRKSNPQKAKFTTETFIKSTVKDLKEHVQINEKYVFALGWSSGGPAIYANSVSNNSPVTGSFVAMSVFWPQTLSDIKRAKDHPYFILHSPTDWIKIDQHARVAVKQLGNAGAKTKLQLYNGGHGWHGDPFGNMKTGIKWLEKNLSKK